MLLTTVGVATNSRGENQRGSPFFAAKKDGIRTPGTQLTLKSKRKKPVTTMSPSIMNQSILLSCPDCQRIFIPAAANEIGDDWDGGKSGSPMAATSSGECPVCGGLSVVLDSTSALQQLDGFAVLAEKAETITDDDGCFITAKFTANNRIELAAWKKNVRAARARKQLPEDVVKEPALAQSIVAMDRYLKVRHVGIPHSHR